MIFLLIYLLTYYRVDIENILQTPLFCEKFPEVIADTLFVKLWYTYAIPKLRTIQQQTKIFLHFIRYARQT